MVKKVRHTDKKNNKLTNKQKIMFMIVSAALVCGIFLSWILLKQNRKILDVAYYRLPLTVTNSLSSQIKKSYSGKVRFKVLPADTVLSQNKAKRYDLLFTWNGAGAEYLAKKAVELPASLYSRIPSSERKLCSVNGKNCMLPLIYDHYEMSFLKETTKKGGSIPEEWDTFIQYLKKNTSDVQIPLFSAGTDNRTLLAFVGALAESLTGSDGYERLIALLRNATSLDTVINEPFGTLSDGKTPVTIQYVLDLIVSWQKSGITHQTWFNGSEADVASFMKDRITAVVFMPLSEHRTLPLSTLHQYESSHFPVDTAVKKHALTAPAVVLISYSKNFLFSDTIKFLISVQAQEALSDETKLAQASSRGAAYDRQSDDVRYWAASYAGGPVPDLMNAVFTSPHQADVFAGEIRKYLGK